MNLDTLLTRTLGAVIVVAGLTTFFGRRNTAAVVDSLGRAFSGAISASLGKGVNIS